MSLLSVAEVNDIASRHPHVFAGSGRRRLMNWGLAVGTVGYLIFAWWFFSVGSVVANGRWDIAGTYLADWVSYEVRPRIEYEDGYLDIAFSRGDPLGENANPDWLVRERAMVESRVDAPQTASGNGGGTSSSSGSFLGTVGGEPAPTGTDTSAATADEARTVLREETVRAVATISTSNTIEVEPGLVTVTRGSETLIADIVRDQSVTARGPLPAWARQRNPGDKIVVSFGFAGRADIEDDEVKISHRFWGWENFLFDTYSPFLGKSAGEVWTLVTSGERIDPASVQPVAGVEQHPLQRRLAASRRVDQAAADHRHGLRRHAAGQPPRLSAGLLRRPQHHPQPARQPGAEALLRLPALGRHADLGAVLHPRLRSRSDGRHAAIFFTDTGTLGKLYSEALENIDDKQREGVKSVGAAPTSVQRYGVVPQVLPVFLSQSLYFWESNTRSATIIGAVGAGGIGLKLWEAMRTNSDWENVAYMVLLILAVVFVFDNISNALRKRLTGGTLA